MKFLQATFLAVLMTMLSVPTAEAQPWSQQVGVPAYFAPGPLWNQLISGAPTAKIAIMNPNSGPGTSSNPAYVAQIQAAQAAGMVVLGYVSTAHLARPQADIELDVDRYYAWYGVDGIFFDEVDNTCPTVGDYAALANYVRAYSATATVALNAGITMSECYASVGDLLMNAELKYTAYKKYKPKGWEGRYPATKFWHLIYATSAVDYVAAVALSKTLNAGTVYVTSDTGANPWDTLPAYFSGELTEAQTSFTSPAFPLSNWSASNSATHAILGFDYTGTWTFRRAYIDSDNNPATGYVFESMGADMLIENGWIYSYTGTGFDWGWGSGVSIGMSNVGGHIGWQVPLSLLGITVLDGSQSIEVQYQTEKGTAAALCPALGHVFQ